MPTSFTGTSPVRLYMVVAMTVAQHDAAVLNARCETVQKIISWRWQVGLEEATG